MWIFFPLKFLVYGRVVFFTLVKYLLLFFPDKFLAFSGPHNKSRIENGESAIWEMNVINIEID